MTLLTPARRWRLLYSAISGPLLASAFPPLNLSLVALLALIPLFLALEESRSAGESFRAGFLCGMAFYFPLLWWIAVLDSPQLTVPWIRIPAMSGVVLYLSLFVGLFGMALTFVRRRTSAPLWLAAPALWTSWEVLRGAGELGFPWGELGYSQVPMLPTLQMASVVGIHGITFWVVLVNALALEALRTRRTRAIAAFAAAALIPPAAGGIDLALAANGPSPMIRVALVQPNVRNDEKWDPESRERIFALLSELTVEGARRGADLVVWPETAAPCYLLKDGVWEPVVKGLARELGVPIFLGVPDYQVTEDKRVTYTNTAALYDSSGAFVDRMDKIQLVPFGEHVPFSSFFKILEKVDFGEADFIPGTRFVLFDAGGARFGNLVCFEATFPHLTRRYVREGADLLVTITNDSWFGAGSGAEQHAQMAIARCVETGRSMARCANSGISLGVDPRGRASGVTELFVRTVSVVDLPIRRARTLYVRLGDWISVLSGFQTAFLVGRGFLGRRERKIDSTSRAVGYNSHRSRRARKDQRNEE
jgi:apolipoprotein N-acyltransferase